MKRTIEELDFHRAFRPVPTKCHDALIAAACSVKEEKRAKRLSAKTVLIAALIIAATMAVAYAAARLGWIEYFENNYGIAVPDEARWELEKTETRSYEVGPMTFTFQQLLTDKRIAMSSARICTTDGSEALCADDTNVYEAVDALDDTVSGLYSLESGISWLEAACETGLPVYGVRALIELDESYVVNDSMEDALWNEDGSIVYFNMLMPEGIGDELPLTLYMAVTQFDPETGEVIDRWTRRESIELPALALLDERTYTPQGENELNGIRIESVYAEQYATGIYLTASMTLPEGTSREDAAETLHGLRLLDGDGAEMPEGLSLSGGVGTDALPAATLERMFSLNRLPDGLILSDGSAGVTLE